uniref:Uncharacterized protein n=1 Tax=Pipistrellus kuhlii TaxID=59472 RepID=A0A7J8A817_PIPKU|nr:hypothetical protein mPipKuh1_008995 [Pipistrellus kuhlii]
MYLCLGLLDCYTFSLTITIKHTGGHGTVLKSFACQRLGPANSDHFRKPSIVILSGHFQECEIMRCWKGGLRSERIQLREDDTNPNISQHFEIGRVCLWCPSSPFIAFRIHTAGHLMMGFHISGQWRFCFGC